jgi:desulfoferrodoxin-like iron-binding protein
MKVFQCKGCGHIEFDQAPEKCLVCRAPKSSFVEDAGALKSPADPANLTDGDKKHIPQIVVVKNCGLLSGCTDVHVKVGAIPHVMQTQHYITYIDAYLNRKFISRTWLSPEICNAAVGLHLNASSGKFTAVEGCNVHGNWMAETDL